MSKASVFVAYPYSFPEGDYRKPFIENERAYPVKFTFADDKVDSDHLLDRIRRTIEESEFSLFDISGWNPNVALELGLASGLNKKFFILFNPTINRESDVPSDIRGLGRSQYTSYTELGAKQSVILDQHLPKAPPGADAVVIEMRQEIIEILSSEPNLKLQEISDKINRDKRMVQAVLRMLDAEKVAQCEGRTKAARWRLTNQNKTRRKAKR